MPTVLVVSDLHCQTMDPKAASASFYEAGRRRMPVESHPVEALIRRIREDSIKADIVCCPGDLTHQVSEQGMSEAFADLQKIARESSASRLLCTLGNHDVDSRRLNDSDPFRLARELHPDFPVSDERLRAEFWAKGFYVDDRDVSLCCAVLNTASGHNDETQAKRGTFDQTRLSDLKNRLAELDLRSTTSRVAMMHHHPVMHSFYGFGGGDVLEMGDQIVDALIADQFRLIIHGHRHCPRIRRTHGGGLVLAAGSFAVLLHHMASVTKNVIHLIDFEQGPDSISGMIRTWEYTYGTGWIKASRSSVGIPHEQEFDTAAATVSAEQIDTLLTTLDKSSITSRVLRDKCPNFFTILPDEYHAMTHKLDSEFNIGLIYNQDGAVVALGRRTKEGELV